MFLLLTSKYIPNLKTFYLDYYWKGTLTQLCLQPQPHSKKSKIYARTEND